LTEAPLNDQKKFLLAECVQAYLPLDEVQRKEYERIVAGEPYTKVKAMNQTVFEKGYKSGVEKGRQDTLLRQGKNRFGAPSTDIESRIRAIHDVERLELLADRILIAKDWDELLADI
jgi:hypothetical protein